MFTTSDFKKGLVIQLDGAPCLILDVTFQSRNGQLHGIQRESEVIHLVRKVPAESVLGGVEGHGFDTVNKVLTRGRLHIAALCVGLAERLIHESVTYAANRRQFDQRIGDFQLIQAMLADSRTEANAARSMVLDAARRFDEETASIVDGSTCKLFASEMVGRVADRAVQIFGGAGYIADYGIERFYRDVRLFRLYEGTSEIQRLIIGRHMMRDAS